MSPDTLHTHAPSQDDSPSPDGLRNSAAGWGWVSVSFHWLTAAAVVGLFALGLWMTDLTYYDPWYKQGPALHKSIGVVLFFVFTGRLAWRLMERTPDPVAEHSPFERKAAHATHWLLYAGLLFVMISGYLISTADGRAISVFDLFEIPATLTSIEKQEDVAGVVHKWLAIALISIAGVHALAALKHHFIDKDSTLKRMLARR